MHITILNTPTKKLYLGGYATLYTECLMTTVVTFPGLFVNYLTPLPHHEKITWCLGEIVE